MSETGHCGPAVAVDRAAGLYIHVPFCRTICSYCHFARTDQHGPSLRHRYTDALIREFELRREACAALRQPHRRLTTCYLGGGTPSVLEPALMTKLITGTLAQLTWSPDIEITAEANPESLTPELANHWLDLGINRISLGIQSLDNRVLKLLGRTCDAATARRALAMACRVFGRVSADWILGPGVERAALLQELSAAVALGVEHFSLYLLEVHDGTQIQQAIASGTVKLPTDGEQETLYLAAREHLASLGVYQYEVANFARPGGESRHNGNYWRRVPYLGLGPGAHGFYGRLRYANNDGVESWLQAVQAGRLPWSVVDPLDAEARRLERVILALRTTEGVPLRWLPRGFDALKGEQEGLWTIGNDRITLTGRGFLRIDTIEEVLARQLADDRDG